MSPTRTHCPALLFAATCAGAPALLPEFLQPSIPTKSNAAWKNAEQRAAERAAKVAKAAGLPQLPPVPVRWVRVPDGGPPGGGIGAGGSGMQDSQLDSQQGSEEGGGTPAPAVVALPAVLPPGEEDRQLCGLEVYFPAPEEASLGGLGSPVKRKPWKSAGGAAKRPLLLDDDGLPLAPAPAEHKSYAPHSQEARDAKSGKGKRRLFLHPVIRSRERCGKCSVSLLPVSSLVGWCGVGLQPRLR